MGIVVLQTCSLPDITWLLRTGLGLDWRWTGLKSFIFCQASTCIVLLCFVVVVVVVVLGG